MTAALKLEHPVRFVTTRLFGELAVSTDQVIAFDAGLPGFPEMRRFVTLTAQAAGLAWLQCLDDPTLAFLMIDYQVATGTTRGDGLEAWAIVTLPRRGESATANLRAPVVIDRDSQAGEQVILGDSALGTAEPVDLDSLAAA